MAILAVLYKSYQLPSFFCKVLRKLQGGVVGEGQLGVAAGSAAADVDSAVMVVDG